LTRRRPLGIVGFWYPAEHKFSLWLFFGTVKPLSLISPHEPRPLPTKLLDRQSVGGNAVGHRPCKQWGTGHWPSDDAPLIGN
jgi:hypothetical protein